MSQIDSVRTRAVSPIISGQTGRGERMSGGGGGGRLSAPPELFAQDKAAIRLRIGLAMMLADALAIQGVQQWLMPHEAAPTLRVACGVTGLYLLIAVQTGGYGLEALRRMSFRLGRAFGALTVAICAMAAAILLLTPYGEARASALFLSFPAVALSLGLLRRGVPGLCSVFLQGGLTNRLAICDGLNCSARNDEIMVHATDLGLTPSLGDPDMLDRIGRMTRRADRIIVYCPPDRRRQWIELLKGTGCHVDLCLPELDEQAGGSPGTLSPASAVTILPSCLSVRERLMKRALDLAVVLLMLPVLLAAVLVVALLCRLGDGGPVFFVQWRVGQGNRLFRVYKFRTMRVQDLDRDGERSTARGDDRVTKLGALMRATSVDELPQLFNVLLGDMSIVGPRPHALASRAGEALFWAVDQRYWHRHAVKPGLTGLAQIRGLRGATQAARDLTDRLDADLEYLADWSLGRDLRIILATLGVIVHRNAY